jgi:hypothetical protein
MCLPLFFAANSLFLGQSKLFPQFLRKPELVYIPSVVIVAVSIFWAVPHLVQPQIQTAIRQ